MAGYGGGGYGGEGYGAPPNLPMYGSGGPEQAGYGGGPAYDSGTGFHQERPPYGAPPLHGAPPHHGAPPPPFGQGAPQGAGYGGQDSHGYGQKTSEHGGRGASSNEEVHKIVCQANPSFYVTERGGDLVLAPGDESNPHQQWIKDTRQSTKKDKEGFPAISLINKGSGLALYHDDKKDKVYLKPYEQNASNESFLWTQSADVGHGYQCIRPLTDIHLNLDADHGDKEHGGVKDGTAVGLHKWNKQENQKWKILPITSTGAYGAQAQNYGQQAIKLSCEANPDYFITARGDGVVLAAGEDNDPRQEWIKEDRMAQNMKDESGAPAFVLINKATNKALQHGSKELDKVGLVPLHGNRADDSVLWTLSADVGKGYKCLRPVRDIHLNLDASHGDEKHGGVHDGTELVVYKWLKRENQKWRLTYLCKYDITRCYHSYIPLTLNVIISAAERRSALEEE